MTLPIMENPDGPEDDVETLKQEVDALRVQLDTRGRRHRRVLTFRKIVAAMLIAITGFLLTASVIGVWGARTTLNTDKWVSTVTPLQGNPKVEAAVSQYLAGQIYTSLDVQQRITDVLPPKAAFLAGPLSSRVRGFLEQGVEKVVASDQFAKLWPVINRDAHKRILAIIENRSKAIHQSNGVVTLDLLPVVNEVIRILNTQIPTLFGHTITLPDLSNGTIPPGLRTQIETQLGITLPKNFAQVPIYKGNELGTIQDSVVLFKKGVILLVLVSFALLAAALAISPNRRRTTVQLGLWLIIAVISLTTVTRAVLNQVYNQVPAGTYRDGVKAAAHTIFAPLRTRGDQLLWLGAIIAVVAYLFGPGRGAVFVRTWAAKGWHEGVGWTRRGWAVARADGPGFAQAHLDPLRIGGVAVAAVLVLWLQSWTSLLIIAILLGAYELLVTFAAGAAPEPPPTEPAVEAPTRGPGPPGVAAPAAKA